MYWTSDIIFYESIQQKFSEFTFDDCEFDNGVNDIEDPFTFDCGLRPFIEDAFANLNLFFIIVLALVETTVIEDLYCFLNFGCGDRGC